MAPIHHGITPPAWCCRDKYTGCSLAVCADADGVGEFAGGTTFDDGCSVAAQADANAQCNSLENFP